MDVNTEKYELAKKLYLYKYLYKDAIIYLERKCEKFASLYGNLWCQMLAYKAERPYIMSAELSGKAEMLIRTEGAIKNSYVI